MNTITVCVACGSEEWSHVENWPGFQIIQYHRNMACNEKRGELKMSFIQSWGAWWGLQNKPVAGNGGTSRFPVGGVWTRIADQSTVSEKLKFWGE